MKEFTIIALLVLAASCREQTRKEPPVVQAQIPPNIFVSKQGENIRVNNDTVYLNDKTYSGFLYELQPNGLDTFSMEGYYKGLLTGTCKKWYPNRLLMEERVYKEGKKNGPQISFWDNGHKKFEFVAVNDAYEGQLKEWNYDGKLIHEASFVNGQEEGAQKMWYDNGKIRANYVIVKGKRYGLLGTKNCKNVSDSIFFDK